MKLPKGAIQPRPAVVAMAPYRPPAHGRSRKPRPLGTEAPLKQLAPAIVIMAHARGVEPRQRRDR